MHLRGLIAVSLAAAVTAVYLQVGGHEFVDFDDVIEIVENPNLPPGPTLTGVLRSFTRFYDFNWTPLTWISLQVDYGLYGLNPAGYLLTNVALHAVSTVLLFCVLLRMTGATWRSAFVAAVFALHPLHVESVAWASERKDCLAGVFWMLTLHAYVGYARDPRPRRYASVGLWLGLGLLAKPTLVTLPFVLLLLDYWPLGRLGCDSPIDATRLRRSVIEKLPLLALVVAVSAVTLVAQQTGGSVVADDTLPLGVRLLNALHSYVVYALQSFWPTSLAAFYPYPPADVLVTRGGTCAVLLIAVSVWVARHARTRPYLAVGWLWYLSTLVPVIGLVQVGEQARADRYMYLPSVGLSLMLAWGAADATARWPQLRVPLAAGGIAALAALAALAWFQVQHWRDTLALWERALAVTEGNYFAHHRLASRLGALGIRLAEAEAHYAEAMRLRPSWADPVVGRADLRAARGDLSAAVHGYQRGLALDPQNPRAHGNLGIVLAQLGRFGQARLHLERALTPAGGSAAFHNALGVVAAYEGREHDAAREYQQALDQAPLLLEAAKNLAWLLATSGDATLRDGPEAIRVSEAALARTRRRRPGLLATLAAGYAASGRFDEAIRIATKAETRAAKGANDALLTRIRRMLDCYGTGHLYLRSATETERCAAREVALPPQIGPDSARRPRYKGGSPETCATP